LDYYRGRASRLTVSIQLPQHRNWKSVKVRSYWTQNTAFATVDEKYTFKI